VRAPISVVSECWGWDSRTSAMVCITPCGSKGRASWSRGFSSLSSLNVGLLAYMDKSNEKRRLRLEAGASATVQIFALYLI